GEGVVGDVAENHAAVVGIQGVGKLDVFAANGVGAGGVADIGVHRCVACRVGFSDTQVFGSGVGEKRKVAVAVSDFSIIGCRAGSIGQGDGYAGDAGFGGIQNPVVGIGNAAVQAGVLDDLAADAAALKYAEVLIGQGGAACRNIRQGEVQGSRIAVIAAGGQGGRKGSGIVRTE